MSLLQLEPREIRYIIRQFPDLYQILQHYISDCSIFVLFYLPDEHYRAQYRRLNKIICDSRYLTVYWYRDPTTILETESKYIVKRENRSFVTLWFDLLINLENSVYLSVMYQNVLKVLKFKHTKFLVVHQSYVIVEDIKIPMHLNNAINLFL